MTGVLCLLMLIARPAAGQQQYHFYYGKVMDVVTRKPIGSVNFSVEGSKTGTVSGKDGTFSFFIDTIPAVLRVSCVGYQTRRVVLDETSFSLTLYLDIMVTELGEVEIKGKAHEPFFRDERFSVRDYLPDSNLIYLLVFKQRLSDCELICLGSGGDTVARSGSLQSAFGTISRDCLGYLHILSNDSGYQIYREGGRLKLIHAVALKKFDDVLKNCVASSPSVLYFKNVTNKGLMVEYFGVNRSTLQKQKLSVVVDAKKLRMLRREQDDQRYRASGRPPDSRDDFVSWNYANKILYRPVRTSLFRIAGYTCIFNIPDKLIEFYDDDGNYSYKLALMAEKVKFGRWTGDIITDMIARRAYTTFISNGSVALFEIDLNSGELTRRITLFHYFPQKIAIHAGFVYYLYDVAGEADNKVLYRQFIRASADTP